MKQSPEHRSMPPQFGDPPLNILDNLIEGCQVIGPDWRYRYVNDAAASQERRPKEQLVARTTMEVYPGIENTPLFSVMRQCVQERPARRIENKFTFPDGSQGWFELRLEPLPEGLFILSVDITERKRATKEERMMYEVLQLVNASETLESLLQEVAEDLAFALRSAEIRRDWTAPQQTSRGSRNSSARPRN